MTCQKIGYPNKRAARKDARRIRSQQIYMSRKYKVRYKKDKKLYVYACYRCEMFHLTTQKKRKK